MTHSMEEIAFVCQAVGFNTIPSWLKPFAVLSTGEQFRCELARRLLEQPDPIVVDEFTSVVDRQVAKIGAFVCAKYVRKANRRFVAVTCHSDTIDWLDPDWVLEPAEMRFERRRLRRVETGCRPSVSGVISAVDRSAWKTFAPFHYMSAQIHVAAKCFCLFIDGVATTIAACLYRPTSGVAQHIIGISRLVTLPDWQGLGLAFVLLDAVGAAFRTFGIKCHMYPAHPALTRSMDRSKNWALKKRPGVFSRPSRNRLFRGGRPCAVFAYAGPALDASDAERLLTPHYGNWFNRRAMKPRKGFADPTRTDETPA
jgi:GNAT superfamily N-acetyltransferase